MTKRTLLWFECPECDHYTEETWAIDRLRWSNDGDPYCPKCGIIGTLYDMREE